MKRFGGASVMGAVSSASSLTRNAALGIGTSVPSLVWVAESKSRTPWIP